MELKAHSRRRRGFTLLEALFAMLIFSVALAGSMGLLRWMVDANGDSTRITQASSLAQAKIEELRGLTQAEVTGGSDTVDFFNRTWVSTDGDGGKHVTVTVTWTDANGTATRSVAQKSYFYGR